MIEVGARVEVMLPLGPQGAYVRGVVTEFSRAPYLHQPDLYEVTFDAPVGRNAKSANFTKAVLRRLSILELLAEAAK